MNARPQRASAHAKLAPRKVKTDPEKEEKNQRGRTDDAAVELGRKSHTRTWADDAAVELGRKSHTKLQRTWADPQSSLFFNRL